MSELAAQWARVSTGKQDEEKDLAAIRRHIGGRYAPGPEFRLHGKSATKGAHEAELHAAIERMAAGEYGVIVAVHSDRISRKDDLQAWLILADAAGGRFEFIEEPGLRYDPADVGSKVMNVVASHMNWEKIQHLRAQVARAHDDRKARGSIVGKVGWGYAVWCEQCARWSEGRPECRQHLKVPAPTDTGRAYVKDIYARAIGGQSLRSIAAWLTAETGGSWIKGELVPVSDAGIRKILTNPIYTGKHTYGDGTVCECEALVTSDMQEQAVKALSSRLRRGQRSSKTLPALLIPKCSDCGGKAYRTATRGPANRSYAYFCQQCHYTIPCELVDSEFESYLLAAANAPEMTQTWVEGSDSASERAEIKRAMRELDPDDDDYLSKASALRDALKALPDAIPGHFALAPTGRTLSDVYAALDPSERRAWIIARGITVAVSRQGMRVAVPGSAGLLTAIGRYARALGDTA